jgi:hypothetical protein
LAAFHSLPFLQIVRESAELRRELRPSRVGANLLLVSSLALFISAITAARTAVSGDVTGGTSNTATNRFP